MKKKLLIVGITLLLVSVGLSGCTEDESETSGDGENGIPDNGQYNPPGPPNGENGGIISEVEIINIDSSYKTVDNKPTSGWFSTGQEADIVLSWFDFDSSGGSLFFNHPMGIASDGHHLLLADTRNNRILIWNNLPTGNTPPDLVLGQDDFDSCEPGTANNKLKWPVAVATNGGKVVVADAYNDRLLVWNTFPTENNQPADLVLGQVDFETVTSIIEEDAVSWPWAVWTDGEKLITTSTMGAKILIWNEFPTVNNQRPDVILTNNDFGTPRNIESDGETYLFIGDHNAKGTGRGGNFIWNEFPTSNDADYDVYLGDEVLWCSEVIDGDLYGTPGYIVIIIPAFKQMQGDLTVQEMEIQGTAQVFNSISFDSGDGSGMVYASNETTEISYFSLYNGGRIVGYFGKPEDREPDFVIGSDSNTNPFIEEYYFMENLAPLTYDNSLIALSGFNGRIGVWKEIPDESGALPDIIYEVQFEPLGCDVYDDKFYVIGRGGQDGGFAVWNWTALLNGEQPETLLTQTLGSVDIAEGNSITFDDNYAYVTSNGELYVWELPFDWNEEPFKVNLDGDINSINSNGEKLAATYISSLETGSNTVILIDIDTIKDDSPEFVELLTEFGGVFFNLPSGVFIDDTYLFVGDTSSNRVLIWNEIPDSGSIQPDIVLGQDTFESTKPKYTKDGLFFPAGVWFDGSYLWVGEYKFSHRLLRYSIG